MTGNPSQAPTKPHPIVNRAFALVEGKPKKEPKLTDADRARLTEVLDAIASKEELEKAILDLLVVGEFFKTQGAPEFFIAFFELVKTGGYLTRAGLERKLASQSDAARLLATAKPTQVPAKKEEGGMSWWQVRANDK